MVEKAEKYRLYAVAAGNAPQAAIFNHKVPIIIDHKWPVALFGCPDGNFKDTEGFKLPMRLRPNPEPGPNLPDFEFIRIQRNWLYELFTRFLFLLFASSIKTSC